MSNNLSNSPAAEVISIGDEMTSGARLDTNSQWITQQLSLLGIPTHYHTTVGDDLARKLSAFRIAAGRADVVIITGGLGPTADDLTRQVMAELANQPLELHQPSLDHIKERFKRFGREMPDNNIIQAKFPVGSTPIKNPEGTAPGIDLQLEVDGNLCRMIALPGVPAEMKQMFLDDVRRELEKQFSDGKVIRHRTIHCFGQGESAIEQMLPDLIHRDREPRVGITASKATISLRIVSTEESEVECEKKISETESIIRDKLGNLVFGADGQQLQDVVVEFFREKQMKLAVVDCALHGLLARSFRIADDKDECFAGAFQFANTEHALTWIPPSSKSDKADAVTLAEYARQMLGNPYERCVGVGICSPIPCPDVPDRLTIPVAISIGKIVAEEYFPMIGHPSIHEERAMKQILNCLRF